MGTAVDTYYVLNLILIGVRCWWRSWLRHCATSRKVVGSIPDGVIGISHWNIPSGRTMSLGSTQPLTEISTRNIFWGKGGRCVADNLTTFMCRLSWNLGASTFWNPQGLSRAVMGLLYLYLLLCVFQYQTLTTDYCLLGCDTLYCVRNLTRLRRNILCPSLGRKRRW
jgi:hypothetical protein